MILLAKFSIFTSSYLMRVVHNNFFFFLNEEVQKNINITESAGLKRWPPPPAQVGIKISKLWCVFFLLCLVLEQRGSHSAFSMQEVLHWMQHQGAGPDPRVNSADEVKQKAERGSPALRGLRGGMLLTLQTKRARPQSSPIPSLIRKKESLCAPSPTRRSICTQAKAKLIHFSSLRWKASAARPSSEAAVRGEERDWEALRLRAECLLCPPLLPLIWLRLQSSIHKPCLEPPNARVWTKENTQCIISGYMMPAFCLIKFNGIGNLCRSDSIIFFFDQGWQVTKLYD